jgi:hypothetical protein
MLDRVIRNGGGTVAVVVGRGVCIQTGIECAAGCCLLGMLCDVVVDEIVMSAVQVKLQKGGVGEGVPGCGTRGKRLGWSVSISSFVLRPPFGAHTSESETPGAPSLDPTMALTRTHTPDMRDYESTLQTLGLINADAQVRGPAIWAPLCIDRMLGARHALSRDWGVLWGERATGGVLGQRTAGGVCGERAIGGACAAREHRRSPSDERVEDGDRAGPRLAP